MFTINKSRGILIIFFAWIINFILAWTQAHPFDTHFSLETFLVSSRRPSGIFLLPSSLAVYTVAFAGYLWSQAGKGKAGRVLKSIILIASFFLILYTRSLILIPVFLGVVFLLWVRYKKHRFVLKTAGVLLTLGLFLSLFFLVTRSSTYTPNLANRWKNWEIAVRQGLQSLPWGAGSYHYWFLYRLYMPPGANETKLAHSVPLQLFAEWGLPGVLLSVWVIFILFRRSLIVLRRDPTWLGKVIGIIAILVHNVLDIGVFDYRTYPFALFLAWEVYRDSEKPHYSGILGSKVFIGGVAFILFTFRILQYQPVSVYRPYLTLKMKYEETLPIVHKVQYYRDHTAQMNPGQLCTAAQGFQPWDAGNKIRCAQAAAQQKSPMTAGWFLYEAWRSAPHYSQAMELWHLWKQAIVGNLPKSAS